MNSIGPLWDGNEVWLVTFGGALFAAFPDAYATSFSGFYLAFMLLLFALIFRAVSLEFRSKSESPTWRTRLGLRFFGSSFLARSCSASPAATHERPPDRRHEYQGTSTNRSSTADAFPIRSRRRVHRRAVRDARRDLPLPQDRGRSAGAASTAGCGGRSSASFLVMYLDHDDLHADRGAPATQNFRTTRGCWIVRAPERAGDRQHPPRDVPEQAGSTRSSASCCTIAALAFLFLFGVALFPNLVVSTLSTPTGT
jgi:cytochrome d ubiquinol oxidase subunit II